MFGVLCFVFWVLGFVFCVLRFVLCVLCFVFCVLCFARKRSETVWEQLESVLNPIVNPIRYNLENQFGLEFPFLFCRPRKAVFNQARAVSGPSPVLSPERPLAGPCGLCLVFWVLGFVFCVLCFVFWVLCFGFCVLCFGFPPPGLKF